MSAILELKEGIKFSYVEDPINERGYTATLIAPPQIAVTRKNEMDAKKVLEQLETIDGVEVLVASRKPEYAEKLLLETLYDSRD